MGKFFQALKKSHASEGSTSPESQQHKIVRMSGEDTLNHKAPQVRAPEREVFAGKPDPRLVCLLEPASLEAEYFKALRAKLLFSKFRKPCRTIMVTSAQSLDGKSFLAANLAVSIARGVNEHVLLVDCDLRQPSLHRFFGFEPSSGLREYLEEGSSVAPYLQKTPVKKLTLLPAGQSSLSPSELLGSEKMRRLVEEVKDRYQDRYIILDAMPATHAADTASLLTVVDGVLLVVRSGKTMRSAVMKAINNVGRDRILGMVFNAGQDDSTLPRYYYEKQQKGLQ
jgi:exopolysaccharide/PEP-CTERM locus tyrosine autokinase